MNGGRHRGPMDIDGCLSSLGYTFLFVLALALVIASLGWFFNKPADVCQTYATTQVIEKNQAQQEILVDKQVCTMYVPSPTPSPFIRLLKWGTTYHDL